MTFKLQKRNTKFNYYKNRNKKFTAASVCINKRGKYKIIVKGTKLNRRCNFCEIFLKNTKRIFFTSSTVIFLI